MPKTYKLKDGRYLVIDETSNGFEYWLYKENKKLIDGGILEKSSISEETLLEEIFKIFNIPGQMEIIEIEDEIEEII